MSLSILKFLIPKSLVEYITDKSTVRQALEKMAYHRYTAIPVLGDGGKYIGSVRTEDIFRYFLGEKSFDKAIAEDTPVLNIMENSFSAPIKHDATMSQLIDRMKERNFAPVVDDRGCFIGLVLRRDVLNFLLNFYNENEDE